MLGEGEVDVLTRSFKSPDQYEQSRPDKNYLEENAKMSPSAVEAVPPTEELAKTKISDSSNLLQAAVDAAIARYEERNPQSKALHLQAVTSLPGGNTRSAIFTWPFPISMKSGKEYQVTSEDGHTYAPRCP